jgi:hypothetical protein
MSVHNLRPNDARRGRARSTRKCWWVVSPLSKHTLKSSSCAVSAFSALPNILPGRCRQRPRRVSGRVTRWPYSAVTCGSGTRHLTPSAGPSVDDISLSAHDTIPMFPRTWRSCCWPPAVPIAPGPRIAAVGLGAHRSQSLEQQESSDWLRRNEEQCISLFDFALEALNAGGHTALEVPVIYRQIAEPDEAGNQFGVRQLNQRMRQLAIDGIAASPPTTPTLILGISNRMFVSVLPHSVISMARLVAAFL